MQTPSGPGALLRFSLRMAEINPSGSILEVSTGRSTSTMGSREMGGGGVIGAQSKLSGMGAFHIF
eukprot:6042716-Prorocentrum_lima.AAC.1